MTVQTIKISLHFETLSFLVMNLMFAIDQIVQRHTNRSFPIFDQASKWTHFADIARDGASVASSQNLAK
jgi:hypothetical protein